MAEQPPLRLWRERQKLGTEDKKKEGMREAESTTRQPVTPKEGQAVLALGFRRLSH